MENFDYKEKEKKLFLNGEKMKPTKIMEVDSPKKSMILLGTY